MADNLSREFFTNLRQGLIACFNIDELRTLCVDLGVDYEALGGEGKEAKARELISYINRRGQLSDLLKYLPIIRPHYLWSQPNKLDSTPFHALITPQTTTNITILFMAADPSDLSRLQLDLEYREIHEKLRLSKFRERFSIQYRGAVRPSDISQALLDVKPQIVHFSAHGSVDGALCVQNEEGKSQFIEPDALTTLFSHFANQIKCILLNACY